MAAFNNIEKVKLGDGMFKYLVAEVRPLGGDAFFVFRTGHPRRFHKEIANNLREEFADARVIIFGGGYVQVLNEPRTTESGEEIPYKQILLWRCPGGASPLGIPLIVSSELS